MLQKFCKTLGFKKKYGLQNSPWGGGGLEVNHIQPVAYKVTTHKTMSKKEGVTATRCFSPLLVKIE